MRHWMSGGLLAALVWLGGCAKKPALEPQVPSAVAEPGVEYPVQEIIVEDPFADAPPQSRPQTPLEPFTYSQHDITYQNPNDGVMLAATVTLPEGAGPFPGVVLISGSGPQDRDSALLGHRPFAVWADYLSRNGVAVLRQDDRGVGKSSGSTPDATIEQKAQDAVAAREALLQFETVDARRTGLMGHSEGAMVATRSTALSSIPFMIWLAGPSLDLGEILVIQKGLILASNGASPLYVEQAKRVNDKAVSNIRDGGSEQELDAIIAAMVDLDLRNMGDSMGNSEAVRRRAIENAKRMLDSAAIRSGIQYDPLVDLKGYGGKFLGVWGSADLQVPPAENLEAIQGHAGQFATQTMDLRVYQPLNHLLQYSETGQISEYRLHPESVHPRILADVSKWIQTQVD